MGRLALTARHTRFHRSVVFHENVQCLVNQFLSLRELRLSGLTEEGFMPAHWPGQEVVPVSILSNQSIPRTRFRVLNAHTDHALSRATKSESEAPSLR